MGEKGDLGTVIDEECTEDRERNADDCFKQKQETVIGALSARC